ncbi:MAG: hypothetical protein HOI89_12035 [Phycisphaerae bacterium]|jgi:hypothetical protein|nr:hypothetical protein [Phycisphaerae bacterium]MBT5658502.1 hypothetical protein [Phycisphaerae bacterium]
MSITKHISISLAAVLAAPATAGLQWTMYRTNSGDIELSVADGDGESNRILIGSDQYAYDQPMTATLSIDPEKQRQQLSVNWVASTGQHEHSLAMLSTEPPPPSPENVRMRWNSSDVVPLPTDLNVEHQVGRFLIQHTGAAGLLLHGIETNFTQPRSWGYTEGDVDGDDQANVVDLLQVITHWTDLCALDDSCQGDADFDGDVDADDILLVLRSMHRISDPNTIDDEIDEGTLSSGIPGEHVAWSWSPPTVDNLDSVVPFIWAPSWRTPEAVAADTETRPNGHRVVFFFANIVNDLAVFPEDACIDAMGNLTAFRSPWIDNGIVTIRERIDTWLAAFVAAGGSLDAVIIDNELTLDANQFMHSDGDCWDAIMDDPRFPSLADDLGFSDLRSINWGNDRYNTWNRVMTSRFDAAINAAVLDAVREYFPAAFCTNYNSFVHNEEFSSLDISGHSDFRTSGGCGSHDSRSFYGQISAALANSHLGSDVEVGNEAWSSLMLSVHRLRGMRHSSVGPLMAWVTSRSWAGSTTWPTPLQNDPLWDELVIHLGMHGVKQFLYWTCTNPLQDPVDTEGNPEHDQRRINDLMSELDDNIGGLSPGESLTQTSFAEKVIASSATDGQLVVWRFSFHPDVAGATIQFDNGEQFYIQPEIGRLGAWFVHGAHNKLTLNSLGSSPLLTAVVPYIE